MNVRRLQKISLVAGLVLALYAFIGFLAVPALLKSVGLPKLSASLAGSVTATDIALNPFSWEIRLIQPTIRDAAGAELFGADAVSIDLQAMASLFDRGIIAGASLIRPRLHLAMDEGGTLNIAKLIPPAPEKDKPSGGVAFQIETLSIRDGSLDWQDRAGGKQVDIHWPALQFGLENVGTLFDAHGNYHITLDSPEAGRLETHGNLALQTFALEGELSLSGLNLERFASYLSLPSTVGLDHAGVTLSGHYQAGANKQKTDWRLGGVQVDVRQIALNRQGQPLGSIDALSVKDLAFESAGLHLSVKGVALEQVVLGDAGAETERNPSQADSLGNAALMPNLPTKNPTQEPAAHGRTLFPSPSGRRWPEGPDEGERPLGSRAQSAGHGAEWSLPAGEGPAKPIRLAALHIEGIDTRLSARSAQIGSIRLQGAFARMVRDKDGALTLIGLPRFDQPEATEPAQTQPTVDAAPWNFKLDEAAIGDSEFRVEDQTVSPAVALPIKLRELAARDLSADLTKPVTVRLEATIGETGQLRVDGQVTPKPLAATLKAELAKLDLSVLQPYLQNTTGIVLMRGDAGLQGDLHVEQADTLSYRFAGKASVDDLITEDRREHREFISWKRLDLNEMVLENRPMRLSIREVVATEPYGRVQIEPDRRINLIEDLSPPGAKKAAAAKPQADGEPMSVVVGNFRVVKGRAIFTDLNLKPASFRSDIEDLNGNIRGLSSQKNAKAELKLAGKIDDVSPVSISGQINPFQPTVYSDIVMAFRDINLTSLSPYSGKFAGYRIERGKLDMDLRYRMQNKLMEGDNKFVLDHLELGEKVESPEATSLPVRLAIALLKDSDGRIDLRLPVSGDLSNPKVSIGGLMFSAFTQLLTKLVSSPVAILTSLVPDGTRDLDTLTFETGAARLPAQEKTKLAKIAAAIKLRPGLSIQIAGEANRKTDFAGVAEQTLLRQMKEAARAEPATLTDADYRRLFTAYYRKRQPDAPEFKGLLGGFKTLEGAAFEQAKRRYLETAKIDDEAIRGLARSRGDAVRRYLVEEAGLTNQQIYLLDAKLVEEDGKAVGARLSVGY